LYLWYRRNAATLMRRGKGPLVTPNCGSPVSGLHNSGAAPYLPLLPLIADHHADPMTPAGSVDEVFPDDLHPLNLCENFHNLARLINGLRFRNLDGCD
jgi:hypothetical protein